MQAVSWLVEGSSTEDERIVTVKRYSNVEDVPKPWFRPAREVLYEITQRQGWSDVYTA